MCPFDDILDDGSKFQYSMLISFPQFIARPKGVLPKAARPKGGLFR